MTDVVIDGSLSCTETDKRSMELWLSSWKCEEIILDVSVLERSKRPVNTVTLQGETTTISQKVQWTLWPFKLRKPRYLKTLGTNHTMTWHHFPEEWKPKGTLEEAYNLQWLFSSPQHSDQFWDKQASFSVQNWASSSGLKQLEHTAHPSCLYSAKFKNAWSNTVTTFVCMA